MHKRLKTTAFVTLLIVSILPACQTTKRLASADQTTICLALSKSNTLTVLTDLEKKLIREQFSRATKDVLKTPAAIKLKIGCEARQ